MFCFAGTAWAEEEWPKDIRPVPVANLTGKVVVLHTNDVHGAIQGYAKIVALRESFEKLGAEVILPDAGCGLSPVRNVHAACLLRPEGTKTA